MNKLSKEKKQELFLVGMLGLGAVVGLIWFATKQLGTIKEAKAAVVAKQEQLDDAKKLMASRETFEKDLEETKEKLSAIEEGMASGDLYSWMILHFNQFALGKGLSNVKFSREEKVPVGLFPNFPYDAAKYVVRGNAFYHDFGKFLADFENEHPYMRVQNVQLRPADSFESKHPEKIGFEIELVVLLKPDEKAEKSAK